MTRVLIRKTSILHQFVTVINFEKPKNADALTSHTAQFIAGSVPRSHFVNR